MFNICGVTHLVHWSLGWYISFLRFITDRVLGLHSVCDSFDSILVILSSDFILLLIWRLSLSICHVVDCQLLTMVGLSVSIHWEWYTFQGLFDSHLLCQTDTITQSFGFWMLLTTSMKAEVSSGSAFKLNVEVIGAIDKEDSFCQEDTGIDDQGSHIWTHSEGIFR